MILGDLGADVIGIEMPRGRRPGDYSTLDSDTHVRWFWYQRNKRSITLDLKTEGGQRVFERLAKNADVIVESFRPGVAQRLSVDYASARKHNPRIIYCSISGFGQTGPYRDVIGHEPNYQGLSGALGTNRITGGEPHVASTITGDVGGGSSFALFGLLAAVIHRDKTGEGQYIDAAITAGIVPYLGLFPYVGWYGDPYRSVLNSTNRRPDFRAYKTKDGKYVAVSPAEPWLWERFSQAIGRPDLSSKFEVADEASRDDLLAALTQTFATRTQAEWLAVNDRENVSITAVYDSIQEIEADPQMQEREMVVEVDYEPLGRVKQVGIPFRMSATPPSIRWMPRYGEHTDEVLTELDFTEADIAAFRNEGTCEAEVEPHAG